MQIGAGQLRQAIIASMLVLCGVPLPVLADASLRLLSNVEWVSDAAWFGGFSGLEISQDGGALILLSDRGMLVNADVNRKDGILRSLSLTSFQPLLGPDQAPLKSVARDAEGLAMTPDGSAFISFENQHRVATLDLSRAQTSPLPDHPDFAGFSRNGGLEALAAHPDGTLFAFSEGRADRSGTTPLYAFATDKWQISHRIPTSGAFRPVGADIGPSGQLYLLERTLSPLGFRSQIRRFDLSKSPPTAQTLLTTIPAAFDNLEALSVWQDPTGATRLTLISDDNFLALQTTQVVEFLVVE